MQMTQTYKQGKPNRQSNGQQARLLGVHDNPTHILLVTHGKAPTTTRETTLLTT